MKNLLFPVLLFLFIASCKHDPAIDEIAAIANPPVDTTGGNGGGNGGNGGNNTDNACDPDTVYFVNDIVPILNSNCAFSGCHGDGSAQDGVDLTTYSSILSTAEVRAFDANESKLYKVITDTDPKDIMPPPPASMLSTEQIAMIRKWINQGALNNSCEDCDTTAVGFASVIQPLIQNYCQGCHSGASPLGGVSLTNYNEIKASALSGALYAVVNHESGYVPMPYNQDKLDQCKIDQIRIWIDEGALNN